MTAPRLSPIRIGGIVFDLDGTLIDSAPDLHRAANALLAERDAAPLDLATVASFIGNGVGVLVKRCLEARALDPRADDTASFMAHYADPDAPVLTRPMPGALEALRRLTAGGRPLGLCTNKPGGAARAVLHQQGMAGFFQAVTGGDEVANGRRKPDPAHPRATAAALGLAATDCLYVGDSEIDAQAAVAAGMTLVLVRGGYCGQPLETLGAAAVLDDLTGLTDLLA